MESSNLHSILDLWTEDGSWLNITHHQSMPCTRMIFHRSRLCLKLHAVQTVLTRSVLRSNTQFEGICLLCLGLLKITMCRASDRLQFHRYYYYHNFHNICIFYYIMFHYISQTTSKLPVGTDFGMFCNLLFLFTQFPSISSNSPENGTGWFQKDKYNMGTSCEFLGIPMNFVEPISHNLAAMGHILCLRSFAYGVDSLRSTDFWNSAQIRADCRLQNGKSWPVSQRKLPICKWQSLSGKQITHP